MYVEWKDMRLPYDPNDDSNFNFLTRFCEDMKGDDFFGSLFYTMHHEKDKIKEILNDNRNIVFQVINDYSIRRVVLEWLQFIEDITIGKRQIKLHGQYTYSQAFLLYHMYNIEDQAIKDKLEANYLMGTVVDDKNLETIKDLWKNYLSGIK